MPDCYIRFTPVFRRLTALVMVTALTACTAVTNAPVTSTKSSSADPERCATPGSPECQFLNAPVQLDPKKTRYPGRSFAFSNTMSDLNFADRAAKPWVAPQGTLTDGASIPAIFVSILGSPRSPEFINAAAVHDAYCGYGNQDLPEYHSRPWFEVHRMFYDGLRAGGTPERKAKMMFAGVFLGGPRWGGSSRDISSVPAPAKRECLRKIIFAINARNLTIPQIEDMVLRCETEDFDQYTSASSSGSGIGTPGAVGGGGGAAAAAAPATPAAIAPPTGGAANAS